MRVADSGALRNPERLEAVEHACRTLSVLPTRTPAIARLAARSVDAPMGLLTLVGDDHEHVAGAYGLPEPLRSGGRMTEAYSVGKYMVDADAPVACPDMHEETNLQVRDHPLARDFGVRAFLGVPIRDAEDRPVGSLTVLDERPNVWSEADVAMLLEVATLVDRLPAHVAAAPAAAADLDARTRLGFADTLLDSLDEGVVAIDRTGHVVIYNRALREIHRHPPDLAPEQAHHVDLAQLHHPDGTPIDPQHSGLARALRGEAVPDAPGVIRRPGLPDRYISTDARPILGPDGEPIGAVATVRDVTDQRHAQQFRDCQLAVARLLGRPGTLAALGTEALGLLGHTLGWSYLSLRLVETHTATLRRVAVWHPAELRLGDLLPERLPRSAHEIPVTVWATGRPVWEPDLRTSPHMRDPTSPARARAYAQRGLHSVVSVPILDGDDVLGVLTCFAPALHHDEFQTTGLLLDFATQAGQFLARRRADDLTDDLRRARADFTGLIGHDMRTPLTTIATYNQLLLDDPTPRPSNDRQLLDGISRNVSVLRELVDGLLDLAALEDDNDPLPSYDVDLTALLADDLTRIRASRTSSRPETVHTDLGPPLVVRGDPGRLRQLTDNLAALAVDRSDPRGPAPSFTLRPSDDTAELRVTTSRRLTPRSGSYSPANATGTGDANTRTGVALVLTRLIAERHGGTLKVTDQSDGSTITVRLPVATSP
ncbi:sensor histidine kinase [Cryptosporangium japonicum]|uniref:Sensor-like histidine kinase SenX3 n=1 Tax=Cryptosporangium japonicum TaxID=80872 RepID=A0ABN0TFV9_9ACTN